MLGGPPRAAALRVHSNGWFPFCVSHRIRQNPVRGRASGPGRPLRKGATFQKQCGPASRVNGYRVGNPGSGCPFSGARKRAKKSAGPGPHKNHFPAGNFITRAGFAPHSNNKISNPLGRLFIGGAKGPDKRQRQQRKRKTAFFLKQRDIPKTVCPQESC